MSPIIFDIETLKQPDEVILDNAPEWSEEEALTRKGNRTKPEMISSFLEEDRLAYRSNLLEKAALHPETATVAIAGFYRKGEIVQYHSFEKDILLSIMDEIDLPRDRVMGFNILGFDLPFFIKRCWINNLSVPQTIFDPMSRYPISDRFVDGMKLWQVGNYKAPFTSLSNAMKAVGLPGKPDGSEFAKLWTEDKRNALEYNRNELLGQASLYRRMGVKL
jgi:DNA polymerase elongation subunit (family B)